ncbi:unnamed protein product [Linum trigynum]|uniref:RNase H type-1 domain-containing protein n=1 Tax=Linum trigynum TaxID=586398 RepID=A0AAV2EIE1_9ROSI
MTPSREILVAVGFQFPGIEDPMVVEMMALREAVVWCLNRGITKVCFEGDAKVIIDKINQADTRDNRVGAILAEVVHQFASQPRFSVRFVRRRSNRVAHLVARKALSLYQAMSRSVDFSAWLLSRM